MQPQTFVCFLGYIGAERGWVLCVQIKIVRERMKQDENNNSTEISINCQFFDASFIP